MPRRELSVARNRSVVAAARSYGGRKDREEADAERMARRAEPWQFSAWEMHDLIGEYRQAPNIMGALLSRAKLVALEKGVPTKNPVAIAALQELYGGEEGQAEMLRLAGIHFTVAGEFWLIAPAPGPITDDNDWMVVAATEISKGLGGWRVNGRPLKGKRLIIRVWRPHPKDPLKADAPTRATLPVLSELLQLTKRVAAQIDSRLTGAGVWFLPQETEFPSLPITMNAGDPQAISERITGGDAQGLADLIYENAQISIQNPERAEAQIPLIATVPGDMLADVKPPITFWSELDRAAPKLREEAITRTARGMDVPPEVLLGAAGSNHWNMWLADENNVKIHGEPTLKIITGALTRKYYRAALEGLVPNPEDFSIGADTSQMRLRPNRSKEATELNDRLILKDETVLRENGFTEADMMDDEDIKRAIMRKAALGQTTPELVAWAWRNYGIEVPEALQDNRGPVEARPTPSLEEHPTRDLPERRELPPAASIQGDSLVFVAEQIIDRALQRAGNRIKSKFQVKNPPAPANRLYLHVDLTAGDLDDLLQDAWGACHEFDYGVDPEKLARAVDFYTRGLIMARREPSRTSISAALRLLMSR